MTRIIITQPRFLPVRSYVERMYLSDVFVYLDDALHNKRSNEHRNKIKTASGAKMLSVPVDHTTVKPLCKTLISNNPPDWKKKHLKTIEYNYRRSPAFSDIFPFVEKLYSGEYVYLDEICYASENWFIEYLGIECKFLNSGSMNISGTNQIKILNICKKLNADTYISGPLGRNYIDIDLFKSNGIKVLFHNFVEKEYKQLYGDFIPNLSVIDLLFNYGKDSMKYIRCGSLSEK